MKKYLDVLWAMFVCFLFALGGYLLAIETLKCPSENPKFEFYGSTVIDADHIERTWIYRDTVEYSRPKIKFTL